MRLPASGLSGASSSLADGSARETQNSVGAGLDQDLPEALPCPGGIGCRVRAARAARIPCRRPKKRRPRACNSPFVRSRPRAERNLAAALQFVEQSALGSDASARFGIVERGDKLRGLGVARARFDSERALADGRKHDVRVHNLRDSCRSAEAIDAGDGQHDGVEFAGVEFFQARVHVAAQIQRIEIGTSVAELRLAAQAAGADARARRKTFQSCGRCGRSGNRADLRAG